MNSDRIMNRLLTGTAVVIVLSVASCSSEAPSSGVEVRLHAVVPNDTVRMMWSPKGRQLPLVQTAAGLETLLELGPDGSPPIALRLERSGDSPYYDRLLIDHDRDGSLDDEEPEVTEPEEFRSRVWSSFDDAMLTVPVVDPESGLRDEDPYPVSFWYVFDPLEPADEDILRMSRRGWMEGETVIDGSVVRVLLTEFAMDGIYDLRDQWAIASVDSAHLLYRDTRLVSYHNWLSEDAWRVTSLDPSGRRLEMQTMDVGITRADELKQMDTLAPDRNAARSGRMVGFETDFEGAEARARNEGKPLFIDFKTVWCGPCHTMDDLVFTSDVVVDASKAVVPVRVDGDERRDVAKRFGVAAYPTLMLIGPDGNLLRRHVGYLGVDSTALLLQHPF